MRNYETARGIFSFMELVGWATVIGDIILAVSMGNAVSRYARPDALVSAILPGLIVALAGLLFVGAVQAWRASVDTAEYTQQMLKIARDQLEVSRQGLTGRKIDVPTFASQTDADESQPGASFADAASSEAGASYTLRPSNETSAEKPMIPLRTDENGFSILNEQGTLLEFRGRQFAFDGKKYDYEGQGFASAKMIKRHLTNLKDLS